MHGSVLFLALATVALGATVRLNTEDTMASASAITSEDRLNPPSLAARSTVVGLNPGDGRKSIEVNIGGVTSGGLSILDTNNVAGILGGNTGILKKRNGSFLGLRRRDRANVIDAAVDVNLNLDQTGGLLDLTQDNGGLLGIDLKRPTDLGAVAQVDLSGQNPTVTVDLSGILGNTRTGAPCAGEDLAAETVTQPANTDATNNNVDGNTIVPSTNVDPNGQPTVATDGNAVTPDVNIQPPAVVAENGNGAVGQPPAAAADNTNAPAAEIAPTQPITTDNTGAAPAVVEVNPIQPVAPVNLIGEVVNTNGPVATDSNGGLLDVKVNTNGDDLLQAKVNPNNDGSLLDVVVNTGRDSAVGTDAVDVLTENVNNLGLDSAAAPKGNSLIDLDLLSGNGHVLDLGIHPDHEHLLSANLGPGDNTGVTLKRRLYEIQKRDVGIIQNTVSTAASSIDNTKANILNVDLKGVEVLGAKLLGTKGSNVGDVANVDLKGTSQGVEILGATILGTNGSNGSILKRRNRDDDDDDEDEDDEDEDEEEEVKESAVNKAKDGKDSHPAADSNNDKKEAAKDDPEKHKNSASAASTSNKIVLLGALVGAVFMLA